MSRERRSASERASQQRPPEPELLAGRYLVLHEIGMGGMARVQLGRILGPGGFVKPVAVKRLHPHLVGDPGFVSLFLDEARLASRVRHPNVVSILDVLEVVDPARQAEEPGAPQLTEVLLVLEYVEGETLRRLLQTSRERGELLDTSLVVSILSGVLHGLYAAHRAMDAQGEPLQLVHRDVSPQNIMLGSDGVARVLDFGVAKGTGRIQSTRDGEIKGKLRYMAPEQVLGAPVDSRSDLFAAGAVLFEALTGQPLIRTATHAEGLELLLYGELPRLADYADDLEHFQPVLDRALSREPTERFQTALEFAIALEAAEAPAPHHEVADWLGELARAHLAKRREQLQHVETLDLSALAVPPRELLDSSTNWARPPTPALGVTCAGPSARDPAGDVLGASAASAPMAGVTAGSAEHNQGPEQRRLHERLARERAAQHHQAAQHRHTATLGGTATPRGSDSVHQSERPAPQRGAYVLLGAALVVAGFAVWAALRGGLGPEPYMPPAAAAPHAAAPQASADQEPQANPALTPAAPLDAAVRATTKAAPPPPAAAPAVVASQARPRAPQPAPRAGTTRKLNPAPAAGEHARSAACVAPVTVDDNGIKHIKPECL